MKIIKKVLVMLLIVTALCSLSGCEDDEANETPSPLPTLQSTPSPKPTHTPTPLQVSNTSDLCGQWVQFGSEFPRLHQVAIISGDTIEIYWVNEEYNTQYLYWSGSFPESDSVESSFSWVSANNIEKAKLSPSSSWDETKEFTYEDGQIYYSTTSVGVTATVHLEQNTWDPTLPEDEFFENDTFSFSVADIEFSIPDFFPEKAEKIADGAIQFTFFHGGKPGCMLTFLEYRATQQEFDEGKEDVIKSYMGEEADRVEHHDVTVANFPGTAFSYHIVNQNNVGINVYGALVHNPRMGKVILFTFTIPREGNYQEFFDKIIIEHTILLNSDLYSDTMGYDLAFCYGSSTTLRVATLFDFDKGIMTEMYIHNRPRGGKYTGTDHILTLAISGDLKSGWQANLVDDIYVYYEFIVDEDGTEYIYQYGPDHDLLDTYRVSPVENWVPYLKDGLKGQSDSAIERLLTPKD